MSDVKARSDWVGRPIHHVLIAAWPVLFLVANNLAEVDPREGIVPAFVAVGSALLLFALLRLARVPSRRAALVVTVMSLIVLTYGHVAGAMVPDASDLALPAAWVAVGIGVNVGILLIPGDVRGVTVLLNAISVVLVTVSLVPILSHLGTESTVYAGGQWLAAPSPAPGAERAGGGAPRDIYYLVVEDYGGPRALAQYLDLADSGIYDWLAQEGFTVLEDTRSNYGRTPLSLASSLNMTYLDEIAAEMGPDESSHGAVVRMVEDAEVVRFLKDRGYSYVLLGSQYYVTDTSPQADVNPTFAEASDFVTMLTSLTILPPIADRLGFEDELSDRRRNYDAAIWDLETFPQLADLPGPKFVFFHLYLPHAPWVVDANGGYVTDEDDSRRPEREQQATQWDFVSREMRRLIEGLLEEPEETAPIIILTTDEGPNPSDMPMSGPNIAWSEATDEQLDQKFTIFAAYRLPGVDQTCLYPGMSSVNTFRVVFDLYFDANLPVLPDRNYIHRDRDHPYDLTDVTDRLPPSSAGSDIERDCPP